IFIFIVSFVHGNSTGQVKLVMSSVVRILGTLIACLMLLGVAVRAAGSTSGEREQQTLDCLLSTRLEARDILLAKWLGSILGVRRLGWILLSIGIGGVVTRGLDTMAFVLLLIAWFAFAAFFASVGLSFSLVSRSTLRATIWTLLTIIGISAAPL